MTDKQENLQKLRDKLRAKIGENQIKRCNKVVKKQILTKTFKKMGIDEEKLMQDIEELKKQGNNLTIEMNRN